MHQKGTSGREKGAAQAAKMLRGRVNTTCSARLTCLIMALGLAVVGMLKPARSFRLMYSRNAGIPSSRIPETTVTTSSENGLRSVSARCSAIVFRAMAQHLMP